MKNTMQLLEKALNVKSAAQWHKDLNLSRNALHSAKARGNLSPAIAGAIAEELGEDAKDWMVIAALESERDSACKSRMLRKFIAGTALALGASAASAMSLCVLCLIRGLCKNRSNDHPPQAGFFCL